MITLITFLAGLLAGTILSPDPRARITLATMVVIPIAAISKLGVVYTLVLLVAARLLAATIKKATK